MAVPSALKLREMRGKAKKPVKFKIEMTYGEMKAAWLVLGDALMRGQFSNKEAEEAAKSAHNYLSVRISKLAVLVPENERHFETKADRRGRKYACGQCAIASVPNPDDICPNCSAPGAA